MTDPLTTAEMLALADAAEAYALALKAADPAGARTTFEGDGDRRRAVVSILCHPDHWADVVRWIGAASMTNWPQLTAALRQVLADRDTAQAWLDDRRREIVRLTDLADRLEADRDRVRALGLELVEQVRKQADSAFYDMAASRRIAAICADLEGK